MRVLLWILLGTEWLGAQAPVLQPKTDLRALSSLRKREEKCEEMVKWLAPAKASGQQRGAYGLDVRAVLDVFRDETLVALLGKRYDQLDTRARTEVYEKELEACVTMVPGKAERLGLRLRGGGGAGGVMQAFYQQLGDFREVLGQAFRSQPGPMEPAVVTRHVQLVRAQLEKGNALLRQAEKARGDAAEFATLHGEKGKLATTLKELRPSERLVVDEYLATRLGEMATALGREWLAGRAGLPSEVVAAQRLVDERDAFVTAVEAMPRERRTEWLSGYEALLGRVVAEPARQEIRKLAAIPASLAGMGQLHVWREGYQARFGRLAYAPALQAVQREYAENQARIYTGALPAWRAEVEGIPVEGVAITAKRNELAKLLGGEDAQRDPLAAPFYAPLEAKEQQLRQRLQQEAGRRERAAQEAFEAERARGNEAVRRGGAPTVTENSFRAVGIEYAEVFENLFRGDFAQVEMERDQPLFRVMLYQYMKQYGQRCDAYLPADKVQLMDRVCAAEEVTRNGFGVEISRVCVQYRDVPTGIWAKPEVHSAHKELQSIGAADSFREAFRILGSGNVVGTAMGMAEAGRRMSEAVGELIARHGCGNAGLMRFEENLLRFAKNQPGRRLGGAVAVSSAVDPLPGIPFRDQDYTRLMEDLVSAQAQNWVMNRYTAGSVQTMVTERDSQGRPAKVLGRYGFQGFNGPAAGTVELVFVEGVPNCLFFFDMPNVCRTPDRKLVQKYVEGGYAR